MSLDGIWGLAFGAVFAAVAIGVALKSDAGPAAVNILLFIAWVLACYGGWRGLSGLGWKWVFVSWLVSGAICLALSAWLITTPISKKPDDKKPQQAGKVAAYEHEVVTAEAVDSHVRPTYSAFDAALRELDDADLRAYEKQRKKEMIDARLGISALSYTRAQLEPLWRWKAHGDKLVAEPIPWDGWKEWGDEVETWKRGVEDALSKLGDPVLVRFKHPKYPDRETLQKMSSEDWEKALVKAHLDVLADFLEKATPQPLL